MPGIKNLPSLRLRDINQSLKLKDSDFGLPTQPKNPTDRWNLDAFLDFLQHWNLPVDEHGQIIFDFDHFHDLRADVDNMYETVEPIVEAEVVALSANEIRLLKEDSYQIVFRYQMLRFDELFQNSVEQGVTKEEVVDTLGHQAWQKVVAHLKHKQDWRKPKAVVSRVQRMKFENYVDQFTENDFYDYLEWKTLLTRESEHYREEREELERALEEKRERRAELEAEEGRITNQLVALIKRQRRLSILKTVEAKAGVESNALKLQIEQLTSQRSQLSTAIQAIREELLPEAVQAARQVFTKQQADITEAHTELKRLEQQKQVDIYADELLRAKAEFERIHKNLPAIQRAAENDTQILQQALDLQAKFKARIAWLEKELARLNSVTPRTADDPDFKKFVLSDRAIASLVGLKVKHGILPGQFSQLREVMLSQGYLINYNPEELHQHFTLRLAPLSTFLSVSKVEFEARVSTSIWHFILNLFKNIWHGFVPQKTQEAFRQRYDICQAQTDLEMDRWSNAVLSRLAVYADNHYSDTALNAYAQFQQMGIAIPVMQVAGSSSRDPQVTFVIKPECDLSPERVAELHNDLKTYVASLTSEIESLTIKKQKASKKPFEGRTSAQYAERLQMLNQRRSTLLERMNQIPCLAKPEFISRDEFETATWAHHPALLDALNSVEVDLAKSPESGRSLLDQINHQGEPTWLGAARHKLNKARQYLENLKQDSAVQTHPIFSKILTRLKSLQSSYEAEKTKFPLKPERDNVLAALLQSINTQNLSLDQLNQAKERCRRVDMVSQPALYNLPEYFIPDLPVLLIESIVKGGLLNDAGRIDTTRIKRVLTIIHECVPPDQRDTLIQLLKCLYQPDQQYGRLVSVLDQLTRRTKTRNAWMMDVCESYLIPRLAETLDLGLARCIGQLAPALLQKFMSEHRHAWADANLGLKILLQQTRAIGSALPITGSREGWVLLDPEWMQSAVDWIQLAIGLKAISTDELKGLNEQFARYVKIPNIGASSDYHTVFAASFVHPDTLRDYWQCRLTWLLANITGDRAADRHFLNELATEQPAIFEEFEAKICSLLMNSSLEQHPGLYQAAVIFPGTKVVTTLTQLYRLSFDTGKLPRCRQLASLKHPEFHHAVDQFHAHSLHQELFGVRKISESARAMMLESAQGPSLIAQMSRVESLIHIFQNPMEDDENPFLDVEDNRWSELFGIPHLNLIFNYLSLLSQRSMPASTLKFIDTYFNLYYLNLNRNDLTPEDYHQYHRVIKQLQLAMDWQSELSRAQEELTLCQDAFLDFIQGKHSTLFDLMRANLKEPVLLSELFQFIREQFIAMPAGELKATRMKAFFDTINEQSDFVVLDQLHPYQQAGRSRLELDVKGTPPSEQDITQCLARLSQPGFSDDPKQLLAIKIGRYSPEEARAKVYFAATTAVMRSDDPIEKLRLTQFCEALASPYEGHTNYHDALTCDERFAAVLTSFEQAMQSKQDRAWTDAHWNTTYRATLQDKVARALNAKIPKTEAVERLYILAKFSLTQNLDPLLIDAVSTQLLEMIRLCVCDFKVDDSGWSANLPALTEKLRGLKGLPQQDLMLKALEQPREKRQLFRDYATAITCGNLSVLSFQAQDAAQLYHVLPLEAREKLQTKLRDLTLLLKNPQDPAAQVLNRFAAQLAGKTDEDYSAHQLEFLNERARVKQSSVAFKWIQGLKDNRPVLELPIDDVIRDCIFYLPQDKQVEALRYLSYRIQHLGTGDFCLVNEFLEFTTLTCPNPAFTQACLSQFIQFLEAFAFLNDRKANTVDAIDVFSALKLYQLGKQDWVSDDTRKLCHPILSQQKDLLKLSDPELLNACRRARFPTYTFEPTAQDLLPCLYRQLTDGVLTSVLQSSLDYLGEMLSVDYRPTLQADETTEREQANRAATVLNRLHFIYGLARFQKNEDILKKMRTYYSLFKQHYFKAIAKRDKVPCGEYFAALVLVSFEKSLNQDSTVRLLHLSPELLRGFERRQQLRLIDFKSHFGVRLTDGEAALNLKTDEILKEDDEAYQAFIIKTLPACVESAELMTESAQVAIPELLI